jgi:hypothetical protein
VRIEPNPEPWVRVFRKDQDPLAFKKSAMGNRFDPLAAPWESTQVLYAGTSLETAIAEAVVRWHGEVELGEVISLSERGDLRPRRVARFLPRRPLEFIDATGLGMKSIEAVVTEVLKRPEHAAWKNGPKPIADDIFHCGADEYPVTQQWGAWFRSQHPRADGIQWVSRQCNVGRCLVLFEDCCGDELRLHSRPVQLYKMGSAERKTLERMLAQLGWGVER